MQKRDRIVLCGVPFWLSRRSPRVMLTLVSAPTSLVRSVDQFRNDHSVRYQSLTPFGILAVRRTGNKRGRARDGRCCRVCFEGEFPVVALRKASVAIQYPCGLERRLPRFVLTPLAPCSKRSFTAVGTSRRSLGSASSERPKMISRAAGPRPLCSLPLCPAHRAPMVGLQTSVNCLPTICCNSL